MFAIDSFIDSFIQQQQQTPQTNETTKQGSTMAATMSGPSFATPFDISSVKGNAFDDEVTETISVSVYGKTEVRR